MAVMALLLPIALVLVALISEKFEPQGSISAYYHTPMRNLFVGVLISIGSFLYLYKGFSKTENTALNAAGILAVLVALLPTSVPSDIISSEAPWLPPVPFVAPYLHGICAVIFFLIIAYVCIYSSEDTLQVINDQKRKDQYRKTYKIYGVLMVVLPVLAAAIFFITARFYLVFIIELVAMWIFAAFWWTKSREVNEHATPIELKILSNDSDA